MDQPIEIAIAVIEHDGKFLIGQRPAGTPLAGLWEFPGGKVEPGETPQQAAARECREETGLSVSVGQEFSSLVHQYVHGKVRLHFFAASVENAGLPANSRFRWMPREELVNYRFPDANAELLKLLVEF